MSNLNGQKGTSENYFIKTLREKLEKMQEEIKTKYKVKIDNLYLSLESLENAINNYILWLKSITPNIPDNSNIYAQKGYNEELKKKH